MEIGRIVHLNSGSPNLTVVALDSHRQVAAVRWEKENSYPSFAIFPYACLR